MSSTFNIPLITLNVGTRTFPASGGASVPDADSTITLTIDRTVANGLNAQPATTTISISTWQSNDGGTTWDQRAVGSIFGGTYTVPKTGTELDTDSVFTQLAPGTSRLVRATVVVAGASVAIAGTIGTT